MKAKLVWFLFGAVIPTFVLVLFLLRASAPDPVAQAHEFSDRLIEQTSEKRGAMTEDLLKQQEELRRELREERARR